MNRYCIDCKWFADGHFSKTYISPRCKQRGDDDAMWMRSHLCGMDGTLYEPNATDPASHAPASRGESGSEVLDV